ncbi:hypothetical protein CFY87_05760 [Actinobacillus seminis]|uniref:Uncharacterized protein n=1 Tax=Actinobacillus seminis TaxID=722 RepID=A0A263HCU1_9PAST|nr:MULTISPECIES: hypothetical protein [Pasteurellaceae]KUM15228.1 hypothetical protein ASV60_10480 [Pasteurella multocida]OZN24842.1 hypothetical protein CFY87_05760 [Actinobacillus seminis]SUU36781.1 Uncharacterised protein [Actinobacillus seminis]SUU36809.1 Uncharacterised protein [Actinobacillus seminis]SUU74763.1 Uncharacterised protein [Actinobacillus seminis]
MNKRKNLGVPPDTHMKIERVAVEITAKTGKVTKWTDVVNFMIDNYLNEAKLDMIGRIDPQSKEAFIANAAFRENKKL